MSLHDHPAAQKLRALAARADLRHLRDEFSADPDRAQRYALRVGALRLDFSRQRIDEAVLAGLVQLSNECGLDQARHALFSGAHVNRSEDRAALHMALRARVGDPVLPQAEVAEAVETRARLREFVDAVRGGLVRGFSGQPISHVLVCAIGGSELGPRMVLRALRGLANGPAVEFLSNVDPATVEATLARLPAATTLVVSASKSFGTQETLFNAQHARNWLEQAGGASAVTGQLVAITANPGRANEFGVAPERCFPMWDWVGGRFSLWSAIGLPIALNLGWERFAQLLAGARAMDQHFLKAPAVENLPVLLALLGVWNRNFLGLETQVIVPYCDALEWLVPYLQQLEMESNGKGVDSAGVAVKGPTVPVIWGGVGTSGQHAFFQALHQSPTVQPVDFLLPISQPGIAAAQQRALAANCIAQSAALMHGRSAQEVRAELGSQASEHDIAWRCFAGNRPSNTILLDGLGPETLGALLAAYEHKTFVQGLLWGLNPFDQWGVELGKRLADQVMQALTGDQAAWPDASSAALGVHFQDKPA